MSTLIEFYKTLLNNVDITTNDEGFILKDGIMVLAKKKPLVLPTKEQLNTVLEKNDEGKYEVTKIPFNPLNEDIVKGDSESLKRLKFFMEYKIGKTIAYTGELLLTLASNKELQKNTNIEINKFLASLSEVSNKNIKVLVDDKMIDNWVNLFSNVVKAGKFSVSIYLKKAGTYEGVKYNRLAVINCDTYEELLKADKDTPIHNIKLRPKDLAVFKLVYEFILGNMDNNNVITVGSNDSTSPAFVALYTLFYNIIERTNMLLKYLKSVNPITVDDNVVKDIIPLTTINDLSRYTKELSTIPNDNDVTRDMVSNNKRIETPTSSANTNKSYPTTPQPVVNNVKQAEQLDPVMNAYYNSVNRIISTPVPQVVNGYDNRVAQPPFMQQQVYGQPYQHPIHNSLAIPATQQMLHQQPMQQVYGQPQVMNPNAYYQYPLNHNTQQPYPQQHVMGNGLMIPAR